MVLLGVCVRAFRECDLPLASSVPLIRDQISRPFEITKHFVRNEII